jgi:hypothetical protein
MYHTFTTEAAANTAQQVVSVFLGCPITDGKYVMTKWAEPKQTAQGKWVFQKHCDPSAALITGNTDLEYDAAWFPTEE